MSKPTVVVLLSLLLAGVLATGCEKREAPPKALTPEEWTASMQAMVTWFECEECEEGELEAVAKYGEAVIPTLTATLVGGASPASQELMRRELARRYDELQAYRKTHPRIELTMSKDEFVTRYLDNFNAQYRTRAAHALGEIGGARAKEALEKAAGKVKREDERDSIKAALASIGARKK